MSIYHGVIRNNGDPLYVCIHTHSESKQATRCARIALREIRHLSAEEALPQGWIVYTGVSHGVQPALS